jgi:hypothetical protein
MRLKILGFAKGVRASACALRASACALRASAFALRASAFALRALADRSIPALGIENKQLTNRFELSP